MPHDIAAFEGDWWLLVKEEKLQRTAEQRWTLRSGRLFHLGEDDGTSALDGNCLIIDSKSCGVMRFHSRDAAPLACLQGSIHDGKFSMYCTFIRVDEPSAYAEVP